MLIHFIFLPELRGRGKLEDEAVDLKVSMLKSERLDGGINWIGLSFVER